jgi:hypothetical protein
VTAHLVVISGIDGSGKSSVIAELEKALCDLGRPTRTAWLRYNHFLTRGVFAIAKLLGLYSYDTIEGRRVAAYHEFHRSRLVSLLFIVASFVDTLFASLVKVYVPVFVFRQTVICDRWIPDILVDMAIDTGKTELARDTIWLLFWKLVPKAARTFVIVRDTQDLLGCREENRLNRHFQTRLDMYEDLCRLGAGEAVDNSGPLDHAVRQILDAVAPTSTA